MVADNLSLSQIDKQYPCQILLLFVVLYKTIYDSIIISYIANPFTSLSYQ